jgi:hypothetical protein
MSLLLVAVLALGFQEEEGKFFRESALGLPGIAAKPAAPPPPQAPAPTASFMNPRVARSPDEYKALLENNVFSPPRKKGASSSKTDKPAEASKPPEPPKPRYWVLTGIVYNGKESRYEALVEEGKESKFVKTGDTIGAVTIGEVTMDQVSIVRAGAPAVVKLKENLAEATGSSTTASTPLKPEEQAEVDKTREKLKQRHRRESVPDEAEEDAGGAKKPKK